MALSLAVALILALQAQQWNAALSFVADEHVDYPGFTTPLAKLMPLRDALSSHDDVLLLAGGMSWNLHHEVAVWDTLLWDAAACVRTIVPDGYAVFPAGAFAAVIAPGAPSGWATDLYRHDRPQVFPTRRGGDDYALYRWGAAPAWSGAAIRPIETRRFANGLRLIGYALEADSVLPGVGGCPRGRSARTCNSARNSSTRMASG